MVRVINLITKKLGKVKSNFSFELWRENLYEPNEIKKKNSINNKIQTMEWLNYSLIERIIKDLFDKTIKIRNQIERTINDNQNKIKANLWSSKALGSNTRTFSLDLPASWKWRRSVNPVLKQQGKKYHKNLNFTTKESLKAQFTFAF